MSKSAQTFLRESADFIQNAIAVGKTDLAENSQNLVDDAELQQRHPDMSDWRANQLARIINIIVRGGSPMSKWEIAAKRTGTDMMNPAVNSAAQSTDEILKDYLMQYGTDALVQIDNDSGKYAINEPAFAEPETEPGLPGGIASFSKNMTVGESDDLAELDEAREGSVLAMVMQILKDNGNVPMSPQELANKAVEMGWQPQVVQTGQTRFPGKKQPNAVVRRLRGMIQHDIRRKGDKSEFVQLPDGFALNDGSHDAAVALHKAPEPEQIKQQMDSRAKQVAEFARANYPDPQFAVARNGTFWLAGGSKGAVDTGVDAAGATGAEINAIMAAIQQ